MKEIMVIMVHTAWKSYIEVTWLLKNSYNFAGVLITAVIILQIGFYHKTREIREIKSAEFQIPLSIVAKYCRISEKACPPWGLKSITLFSSFSVSKKLFGKLLLFQLFFVHGTIQKKLKSK